MRGSKLLNPREWAALQTLVDFGEVSQARRQWNCVGGVVEAAATLRARIERDHHRLELKRLRAGTVAPGFFGRVAGEE